MNTAKQQINVKLLCELSKPDYIKLTGTNPSDYENIVISLEQYFKTKQKKKEADKIKVNSKLAAYDDVTKKHYLLSTENKEVFTDGNWAFKGEYLIYGDNIQIRDNLKLNDIQHVFHHYYDDIIEININDFDFELVNFGKIKVCKYTLKDSTGKVFTYGIQNEYFQKLIKPILNHKDVTFETCTTDKVVEDAYADNLEVLQKMLIKINNQAIGCIMPCQII